MFPYFVFIIFILYFFYRRQPKFMLWTLILFAALRYNVGWDYASYVNAINNPSNWENAETSRHSFVWRELFRFAYFIKSPHIAIIIPNILSYICVYKALKKLNLTKRGIADALFVYTTWSPLFLGSFSTIRQAFAMAVGLLLFAFVQNRQYIKSIVLYIFAILLHPSAIILIFIYIIFFIRDKLNFISICISSFGLIFALFSLKEILGILGFLGMEQYEIYLKFNESFGGKIIYVNIVLMIYLLIIYSINNYMDNIKRQCYFFSIISLSGSIAVYFLNLPNVLSRTFLYFIIFMIVILLPSINKFRYKKYLRSIACIILILYFFTYLYITRSGIEIASSGYLPYNIIFFN